MTKQNEGDVWLQGKERCVTLRDKWQTKGEVGCLSAGKLIKGSFAPVRLKQIPPHCNLPQPRL